MNQVLATERIGPLRRGISCYARPTYAVGSRQMQRTCTMILKDGKLVCRGAGDSHLPRSPHGLFPRQRFQPLTDEERSSESRWGSASQQGIPPELSNLINQVLAIERIGPLRRGISPAATSLCGWTVADAAHLHHTIFINTANLFYGCFTFLFSNLRSISK